MERLVKFMEIPVTDFERAAAFYRAILNVDIQEVEMMGSRMGFFQAAGQDLWGAIVKGEDYTPSSDGVLVYLNAGDDVQKVLDKIEPNVGRLLAPKMQVSEAIGFIGIFTDTEGNKIAVHSNN